MNQTVPPARGRILRTLVALPFLLGACETAVNEHGYAPRASAVERIELGAATRDQVRQALGTPAATGVFDRDSWYYAGSSFEKHMFFDPKLVGRTVVAFRFGPDGVVRAVEFLDEGDGREIEPVARETPTQGQAPGVVQQLLGNIGRFSGSPGGEP